RMLLYVIRLAFSGLSLRLVCVFFFSSRRRHTRWPRDWSSDVCSSELKEMALPAWVAVKLFSATQAGNAISFNLLHKTCGSRLKQIGRASCRERGVDAEVAGALDDKKT